MLERGFKVSPGFVTQVAITPIYVSNILRLYCLHLKSHNTINKLWNLCLLKNVYHMPKAYMYIAIVRNNFVGPNFGKPELIGTKLYTETSTQVARTLQCKLLCPLPNWRKMAPKRIFVYVFVKKNNALSHPLTGSRFQWNVNTKREFVWPLISLKQNCEIFPITDHLSRKNCDFFGTLLALAFWPWPIGPEGI